MNKPLVSIITINFNQASTTAELLRTLEKVSYPAFEVIVVDNGSTENIDWIVTAFPTVTFLKTGQNLGFSGGNNVGMRIAKGDYFLLLNNDTEVPEHFLEPMVERMLSDPTIGALSPKIIFHAPPQLIQYAGFTPINPYTMRGFSIGFKEVDNGQYAVAMPTSRAHGAAMLISRKVVNTIGLMPEIYFLYYEEMDYCEQIKRAGYTIWYEAQSMIYHKESVSTGKNSVLKTYYLSRNRLLYTRRNVSTFAFIISSAYFALLVIPKSIFQFGIRREWKHLSAFMKGILWNFQNRSFESTHHLG